MASKTTTRAEFASEETRDGHQQHDGDTVSHRDAPLSRLA